MLSYPFEVQIGVWRVPEVFSFILRPISRWEYIVWEHECRDRTTFEDRLLKEAVLSHPERFKDRPWNWDEVYAGVADRVIGKILSLSGYGPNGGEPDPDVISPVLRYFDGPEARCDLCILLGSQGLSLIDILKLSPYEYYMHLGMAKRVLAFNGIDPEMILDPNWKPKKGRGLTINHKSPTIGSHDVTPFRFHESSRTGTGSAHDRDIVQEQPPMIFTAD